jgi:hypothetical protein
VALLRAQIHQVHELLDEKVTAASQRARSTPALEGEVLSLYVHAVCIEDATVNSLLRALPPVFKTVWIGGRLEPWDLAGVQGYAKAVHGATDVLLARLTPADLQTAVDLSDAGLGRPDTTWVLNRFILWEAAMTCGHLDAKLAEWARMDVSPRAQSTPALTSQNGHSNRVRRGHSRLAAISTPL